MEKKITIVKRTARYFLSKKIDEKVNRVIFVLHGYAQNADDFLSSCISLASEETLLVAPEGLSKFYWKDFTSKPSSSWMTSLERDNELEDTMDYLSQVLMEIKAQLPKEEVRYYCLGFSQGAATASRFACNPYLNCSQLFLYGGAPAHDLNWEMLPSTLLIHLIYGDEDPLVSAPQVSKIEDLIMMKKFKVSKYKFKGKHKIEVEPLNYLKRQL